MRTLRMLSAALVFLGFTTAAHAEFGVGVFGSYHMSDSYTFSGPLADKVNSKSSSNVGALVFLPILPYFSIRTGLVYESLNSEVLYAGGAAAVDTKLSNTLIPLNLHFEFPITGLYAFGGVIFVSNSSTEPSTMGKAGSDTRTNLGIGYDFLSLTLLTLSAEVEMQKGSKNVFPDATYDLKTNHTNLNIMARFTL
jgi:hypothetical protein